MIKAKEKLSEVNTVFMVDETNVLLALADTIAKKYKVSSQRAMEAKGVLNPTIKKMFKHNWNKDNFGPLKIPAGKIFVIGDNRDNSDDSRYSGFINTDDIVGVVVFNGN
jgi:signal peptidase I